MPVWLNLSTNIIAPGIMILFMLWDNNKGEKCVDISVLVA